MNSISIGGKEFTVKESLQTKPYAPISVFNDLMYISAQIKEILTEREKAPPWDQREAIKYLWDRMCRLFFDDIEGLSVHDLDQIDMEDLNRFFGEYVAQRTRVRSDGSVIFLDSLTIKDPSQSSPPHTKQST